MTVTEPTVQTKKKRGGRPPKNESVAQPVYDAPTVTITNQPESPEEERARLLTRLAEIGGDDAPKSRGGQVGPNYWTMGYNQLKTMCLSKGIVDRTGIREAMIAQLQSEDQKSGLNPCPRKPGQSVGIPAGNTPVHSDPKHQNFNWIVDADGNKIAIVYRIGKIVGGQPVMLDLEANTETIVAALNQGRFA